MEVPGERAVRANVQSMHSMDHQGYVLTRWALGQAR